MLVPDNCNVPDPALVSDEPLPEPAMTPENVVDVGDGDGVGDEDEAILTVKPFPLRSTVPAPCKPPIVSALETW